MKTFVVVLAYETNSVININVGTYNAQSEEEAFGIAVFKCKDVYGNARLANHFVYRIYKHLVCD